MTRLKTRIAAAATVVGLGGIAGLALGQGHQQASPEKTVADKPVVHTKVIKRTIHVTKHAKPKHPRATAGVGGAAYAEGGGAPAVPSAPAAVATGSSSTGAATEGSTYSAEPVTTSTSGAAAVESESSAAPVTTSTSGAAAGPAGESGGAAVTTSTSGGGGGGGESEGGDGGHDD